MQDVHYKPETTVPEGIKRFVAWYRDYYGVQGKGEPLERAPQGEPEQRLNLE